MVNHDSDSELSAWDASDDEDRKVDTPAVVSKAPVQKHAAVQPVKKPKTEEPKKSKIMDSKSTRNQSEIPKKEERQGKQHRTIAQSTPANDRVLRSPICCIMGHVDTGKTKLLDKIRRTNVQGGEAGGITQQIGATFFPTDNLISQCKKVDPKVQLEIPGLLIIDTPGHASFSNLRKRGSSLCDIAIVVVDIMHGVELQTLESLQMLKQRKCPFVIALNKIDRCFNWKSTEFGALKHTFSKQSQSTMSEFKRRAQECLLELTQQAGMNFALYFENPDPRSYVNVIPTSAISGEGIPDLLTTIVRLTQTLMVRCITLDEVNVSASVLDVKKNEGLGPCIDVILVSGALQQGDRIMVCGMNGPIQTHIRALVTPHPLRELRVKSEFLHHQVVRAAMGVKIAGPGLELAVAGTSLAIIHEGDDIAALEAEVQADMSGIFNSIDKTSDGVYVVASTLGSLEALLDFLRESKIPVNNVNIGTVHKLDVVKASTMREREHPEYSVILAFDVKIENDAREEAIKSGVTIYTADIIYHLFDQFTKHMDDFRSARKAEMQQYVIYPAILKMLPTMVYNKKDPLIFGVDITDGELRVGTPLYITDKNLYIGKVESIELDRKKIDIAPAGKQVCIKVLGENVEVGKQMDKDEIIVSKISRRSIDVMKEFFAKDLPNYAPTIVKLKEMLEIE